MKILFAPAGTRGDVEPLIALALEMERRGHQAVMCAPADYADLVREHGLQFELGAPSYGEFLSRLRSTPFLKLLAEQIAFQFQHLAPHVRRADAVVGLMLQVAGPSLAECHGLPYFSVLVGPVFLHSRFHPPSGGQYGNAESHLLQWAAREAEWNEALLGGLNHWRNVHGLHRIPNAREYVFSSGTVLFAWDQALAPVPRDAGNGILTGSLCLETGLLQSDIIEFCQHGPRLPVFIGFGSMTSGDMRSKIEAIFEGVRDSGHRAIVSAPPMFLNEFQVPSTCKLIAGAPFWQLFPKCAAIIHHGGAGTTGTAARAGVPQAVIPQWSDQYFWAERVGALGIGPVGFNIEELGPRKLSELICRLYEPEFGHRAALVAKAIDSKEGIRLAADAIEQSRMKRL